MGKNSDLLGSAVSNVMLDVCCFWTCVSDCTFSHNDRSRSRCLSLLQSLHELSWWSLTITLRVVLSPSPQVLTSIDQGPLCLPAQFFVGAAWITGQIQNISCSSANNLVWKIPSNRFGESFDHLKDCRPFTCAQVPGSNTWVVVTQVVQGS